MSTTLFSIRVFSQVCLQKDVFRWDDLVVPVSWVLDIIRAVTFQKALNSIKQIAPVRLPQTIPAAAFWVIFTDVWAFLSIALPKLAIGILIIRLFRPQRWLKISIMMLCVALNILTIVGFITTFVQCDPAAGQWNPFRYPQTHCWDRAVTFIYFCTVNGISALLDITFSVYPSSIIWGLQMPTWKKLSTMGLLGLGLASFAFAVVKLIFITALFRNRDINILLYDGIRIGVWNSIENDFVLSAACLPYVPPFFRACKLFVNTHIASFSQPSHLNSFRSFRSSRRSGRPDNNLAIELAQNGEPPGTCESKPGKEYWGLV